METIVQQAFLVRPSISVWTARKLDRAVTRKTADQNHATDKARVKVYKSLISDKALEAVQEISNKARSEHRKRTVPWHYDGPGAITAAGYADYLREMESLQAAFSQAVEALLSAYAPAREAARADLGTMYDETDYPAVDVLRQRFSFTVASEPIPQSADFRVVGLSDAQSKSIKADMEKRLNEALEKAQGDCWDRIVKRVEHMRDTLRQYQSADESTSGKVQGKFHDTLVGNVRELISVLPSLNITNNPDLTAIAVRLERELCAEEASTLREDATTRKSVADSAEQILQDVWAKRRATRLQAAA